MQAQDNCAICLRTMKRKELVRLLPCRHLFHQSCFQASDLCYLCRRNISGTEHIEHKMYKKNSASDRARIVEASNMGSDWVQLAKSLGINYKTAYSWITSGRTSMLPRGHGRERVLQDGEVDIIIGWIEENCTLTLKEVQSKILREFSKSVCVSTVANYLEGRLYTVKNVHSEPITMNNEQNKQKRAEYVTALQAHIQSGKQILYIDETNFNLFCRRTRGRSIVGSRAVQILPAARGPNIHLIGAIDTSGV